MKTSGAIAGSMLAVAGLACVWTTGCQTVTTGRVGQPAAQDSIEGVQAILGEARRLNIMVLATGGDPVKTDPVAQAVKTGVEGRLAEKEFNLDAGAPDVTVTLGVQHKLYDRAGEYCLYEGTVDASVTRTRDRQVLGQQVIPVKGTRQLGDDNARRDLGEKMTAATADWVVKAATSGANDLAAVDITIRRPWRPFSGSDMASYARLFVEQVPRVRGVLTCRLVSQDAEARTVVFRVVYYRQEVPEGILNRLAGVPALAIRPN